MIAPKILQKKLIPMVKYIACDVIVHVKHVILQVLKEIINVQVVNLVTSLVQQCMEYVIKFLKKVNIFIMKNLEKEKLPMNAQNICHI